MQSLLLGGLCKTKPIFKPTTLSAIVMIALRYLVATHFHCCLLAALLLSILFVLHILSKLVCLFISLKIATLQCI